VHGRRAGGGYVHNARVRQRVLKPQAGATLLRGLLIAAFALGADRVLHGMGFVENDHSVEIRAQPFNDLPHAGKAFATVVGA